MRRLNLRLFYCRISGFIAKAVCPLASARAARQTNMTCWGKLSLVQSGETGPMSSERDDSLIALNRRIAWLNAFLLPIMVFWCLYVFYETISKHINIFEITEYVLIVSGSLCLLALNGVLCVGFAAASDLKRGRRRGRQLTLVMAIVALLLVVWTTFCLVLTASSSTSFIIPCIAYLILVQATLCSFLALSKLEKAGGSLPKTEQTRPILDEEAEEAQKNCAPKEERFHCKDQRFLA
jgi:hypothetical protein